MRPKVIETWHRTVESKDLSPFMAIVHDDAIFESPALHKPQVGKAMVQMYLGGAMLVLNNGTFRYLEEWYSPRSAVLEFEAVVNGLTVNGVDIVRWNDEDQVTHFKVMVRPFKGLTALMEEMKKLLEAAR